MAAERNQRRKARRRVAALAERAGQLDAHRASAEQLAELRRARKAAAVRVTRREWVWG
jgi:hypothetical protein